VPFEPGILARGPWALAEVGTRWRDDAYEPPPGLTRAADDAIAALLDRGSPSHDGMAARLAGFSVAGDRLELELQPIRWSLRLVEEDASGSLAALCVTRDAEGRWLAGRRAAWLASWPGRWALGAGGAVEVGENPVDTLARELQEEWAVAPDRLAVEALVCLPNRSVMLIGQAWLPDGAEVDRDREHDAHAWWPADVGAWPQEADPVLRRTARLLAT
jgi:ADP-ribose pyrophosphatase YjhB (NUDIX family)